MPLPLIATDLDGTLLMTGSQSLHPDAYEAVHQAISAGIPLVFATGRSPVDVLPVAELVGHRWFAVCNDGTVLVDLRSNEVISTHPLEPQTSHHIVSTIRKAYPDARFMIDRVQPGIVEPDVHGLIIEEGFKAPWADLKFGAARIPAIEEFLDDPHIVKICLYIPTESEHEEIFHHAKSLIADFSTVVRIQSDEVFMDICKRGVSKASGVSEVAEFSGIHVEDVFAVGDLHNDSEMLGWAGFSFAVANAHPEIQDIADVVVPSNDEGGVAQVVAAAMEHLLQP